MRLRIIAIRCIPCGICCSILFIDIRLAPHPPRPQISVTDTVFTDNTATNAQYAGGALSLQGLPPFSATVSKSKFLGNNTAVNGPDSPGVCIMKFQNGTGINAKVTGCTGLVLPSKLPYPTAGDCNVAALKQSFV